MSAGRDRDPDRRHSPWYGFWLSVAVGLVVWLYVLWLITPRFDCCG